MEILRAVRSEVIKMKHQFFYLFHVLLPVIGVVVFLTYYRISIWDIVSKVSSYYFAIAAAFPVGIAVMIGKSVEVEQENQFQRFLMYPNRWGIFFAKFLLNYFMGSLTAVIAVMLFQKCLFGTCEFLFSVNIILTLWVTNLIIYEIHLFLTLYFGKVISILTAVCGSIIGIVMITGLGEYVWKWVPYCMAGRIMGYLALLEYGKNTNTEAMFYRKQIISAFPEVLGWIVILTIGISIWVYRWEGRSAQE
ncbi:lantibiotic immunity ABC transporter MutG family permease subunit [Lachnospiraceae bacterium LCP25S3_G4]